MSDEKLYDIFVSYALEDRAWAEGYLIDALEAANIRIHSAEAFQLGVPRLLEFENAVRQSKRTLLVLSPAYMAEGYTGFVDLLAQTYGEEVGQWPVIPLVYHQVDMPTRLRMLTHLNATDEDEWASVVERLCRELGRPVPTAASLPDCPYPGMKPFTEENSDYFFGRDDEIDALLQNLHARPFVTLIGPSGSGKSSLVYAGLLPGLATSSLFRNVEWLIRDMRPGTTPYTTLTQTMQGNLDLATLKPNHEANQKLLLIVDQFEETFTLAQESEATRFMDTLLGLIQAHDIFVVLTVRADFYADLMTCPLWQEIRARRQEVIPLDEDHLRAAITRPAENVHVYVQTALVERLLSDATGEPGVLPFVQETLVLLWDRVERRFLPLSAYETLILPRGAYGGPERTGLQVALALHADHTLGDLASDQQALARRILLRLIQYGEGRADTRRQQDESGLRSQDDDPDLFEQVLQHLAGNRLLTVSGKEQGERSVDISHEALITGWPTLSRWAEERRDAEQTRRRLEGKVLEWKRLGSGLGGLLDEDELREAEHWMESEDASELGFSQELTELIQASQSELEHRAQRERRNRYFQIGAITAVVLLLIAVLVIRNIGNQKTIKEQNQSATKQAEAQATIVQGATREAIALATSVVAEKNAKEQLAIAQSRQVAAQANNRLDSGDPQKALLLGIAAVDSITQTVDAKNVVRAALRDWRLEQTLAAHDDRVSGVIVSPDGRTVATISADQTARLWSLDDLQNPVTLVHMGNVSGFAFNPDGQWVATSSREDFKARIWDVQTGSRLYELDHNIDPAEDNEVRSILLAPDRKTLATRSGNKVRLWNAQSGEQITDEDNLFRACHGDLTTDNFNRREQCGNVRDIAFDPDQRVILGGSDDVTAWLWEIETGRAIRFGGFAGPVDAVRFTPDGEFIIAKSSHILNLFRTPQRDGTLDTDRIFALNDSPDNEDSEDGPDKNRIWIEEPCGDDPNRRSGLFECVSLKGAREGADIWSIQLSPNGQYLAAGRADGTIHVWDLRNRDAEPIRLPHGDQRITGIAFSPDSLRLATTSLDNSARLWEIKTQELEVVLSTAGNDALSPIFTRDGSQLLLSDEEGNVYFWRVQPGGDVAHYLTPTNPTRSLVTFSGHDGDRVVFVGNAGRIEMWNPQTGALKLFEAGNARLDAVAVNREQSHLAVGGFDDAIHIVEISTGEVVSTWQAHLNGVRALEFWPRNDGGEVLISSGGEPAIRLWDWRKGEAIGQLTGHSNDVNALVLDIEGDQLYSASSDGTVRHWNLQSEHESQVVMKTPASLLTVALSRDKRYLATAGYDNRLFFRALDIPQTVPSVLPSNRYVRVLAFGVDNMLLSGDEGGVIQLWDLETKEEERIQAHSSGWVTGLDTSHDGRLAFSVGSDGVMRAWPLHTEDLLVYACQRANGALTLGEWQSFMPHEYEYTDPCQMVAERNLNQTFGLVSSHTFTQLAEKDSDPLLNYFETVSGSVLRPGECVTIRWAIDGINALYRSIDGDERKGEIGNNEKCFDVTEEFRLIAIKDDEEFSWSFRIASAE